MTAYLIVAAVTAAACLLTTPLVRRLAVRLGAVDVPNDRKVHRRPTPTMGGLALYVAMVAGLGIAWALPETNELFRTSSEPLGVLIAASIVVAVGLVDDLRGLGPWTRVAGQIVAAGVLVFAGVQLFFFWLPSVGLVSLSADLSALLTIGWTIAIINAMNLIDGLDGLAAGVAGIAAMGFFAYAYQTAGEGGSTAALLSAIVVGATLGFLPQNFNPARIFMGDSGAYLLGLLLASATVSGVGRTTEPQFADVAGLVVPVLLPAIVLAIPLADVGFAVARRMKGGRPVFHPDKSHIHHWLLDMATSHRGAVLVMYLWSALIVAAGSALAFGRGATGRIAAAALAGALVVTVVTVPRLLRRGARVAKVRDSVHNQASSATET